MQSRQAQRDEGIRLLADQRLSFRCCRSYNNFRRRGNRWQPKQAEKVLKTGDFKCDNCGNKVHVTQGDKIPECPKCGNNAYETREHQPGTKG